MQRRGVATSGGSKSFWRTVCPLIVACCAISPIGCSVPDYHRPGGFSSTYHQLVFGKSPAYAVSTPLPETVAVPLINQPPEIEPANPAVLPPPPAGRPPMSRH